MRSETWASLDVLTVDGEQHRYEDHYPDGQPRVDMWEDLSIMRGTPTAVDALVEELDRTGAPMRAKYMEGTGMKGSYEMNNAEWDVCVMATVDARLARMATSKLPVGRCFAFVHEQLGLPYGAWSKAFVEKVSTITQETLPVRGVLIRTGKKERDFKEALAADLQAVELLCTSEYVKRYVLAWAPEGQVAHCCYAADYGLFDGAPIPRLEPWRVRATARGPDRDARATAKKPEALDETPHMYATVVSPCKAKGIDLFIAIAEKLPHVPFLAVVTKWTKDADKARLADLRNVRLLPGAPSEKMDAEVWRRTRILIAPSLWPEPFGLVAIEASLRGIPAISTDVAGLREANVTAEFVVPTPLVHDVEIDATYRLDDGLEAFERQRPALVADIQGDARPPGCPAATSREADDGDVRKVAATFVELIEPLMSTADSAPLRAACARARERAWAHLDARRHAMPALFREGLGE